MTEQEWIGALKEEGYANVQVSALPAGFDNEHSHYVQTVHVILEGEVTLVEKDVTRILRPGDRFEISAGTTHTAKTGPHGCRLVAAW